MKILVTGGNGYIGSHTVLELLKNGDDVIVVDNLSNSKIDVVDKIKQLSGKDFKFIEGDVCDYKLLNDIFDSNQIDAVIHFAGYKSIGESVENPMMYYENNLDSTINLVKVMKNHNCKKIVFSSSATVYGAPDKLPISETAKLNTPTNPYGKSKLINEWMLSDLYESDNSWGITLLRYFNPIGSEKEGLLGEDPKGIPNNIMPYIARVATGELECLSIFGDDYPTHDGTGVRDYIHVVDLAKGHLKALEHLKAGLNIYNLGTGKGYSVKDLINAFEKVNNVKVNNKIVGRREGDVAECYADPQKAYDELFWKAELGIEDMCRDSYYFLIKNKSKR